MADETSSDAPNAETGHADSADSKTPAESGKLTPEEQMALYEEQLKEDDWGHQPC